MPRTYRFKLGTFAFLMLTLLALLIYSFDRSSQLLTYFEIGPNAELFGRIAAAVIELAEVALILGDSITDMLPKAYQARQFSLAGIGAILMFSATANLTVSWVNGNTVLPSLLGTLNPSLAHAISFLVWFLSNFIIPLLIFVIAKLASYVLESIVHP